MIVELRDVEVGYAHRKVITGLSKEFKEGVYVIIGHNGAGKTTLLKAIAGIVKPSKGVVLIDGVNIAKASRREAAKLVGYVWQNPYYGFVEPRVIDELSLILRLTGLKGDWSIVELLMGPELYYRNPFTLSGGEAKRVSIASVLIADQPVWLLDEPFDYLDGEGVRAVMKLINYGRQRNKVIIVATVNTGFISALRPNLVIIMRRGSIVYEAPYHELSEAVLNDNNVPPRDLLCG